jgi:hypothetical protein
MTFPTLSLDQEQLARYAAWTRAWTPWLLVRWCRRHWILTATVLIGAAILLAAGHAWADSGTGASDAPGDPLIAWMGIKDTQGVPIAKYTLTLNQGNATPSGAANGLFAWIDSIFYENALIIWATGLWIIKFCLQFQWLDLFTTPFQTIGDGINKAMDQVGLLPIALGILAVVVVITALAGKVAKAVSHIVMAMMMIGLAATIFANPLADLLGSNGWLAQGRDTGLGIATTVSGGAFHSGDGKADVDGLVSQLADRFVRSPTQMINFGRVSDSISRKCQEAWTNGIKNGHGDNLKDDMQNCDSKEGKAMHDRTMGFPGTILVAIGVAWLLGLVLIGFACFFVWHVVRCAVQAMLYAALAPPAFMIGVIPGGPTVFAWKTVLDCVMAYLAMIVYTGGFGAYNVVLDSVFHRYSGSPIEALYLTSFVLAIGFAFFGPLHKMFTRGRDNMASTLGRGTFNASGGGGLKELVHKAADAARIKREISEGMGWDRRGGSGGGAGSRGPVSMDSDSESSTSSADSSGSGDDGHTNVDADSAGSNGAGPTDGPAQPTTVPDNGTGNESAPSTGGGGTQSTAQPVAGERSGSLQAAWQIMQQRRRASNSPDRELAYSGAARGADGRYAMSESA